MNGKKGLGGKLFVGLVVIAAIVFCVAMFGSKLQVSDKDVADILELLGESTEAADNSIAEDGAYTSRDDIAAYLKAYSRLPDNFITKEEAQRLGWSGGDLWAYADGKSIGGDRFGNYDGLLPDADGRVWYECDVGYCGGSRGALRIVWSNDGLIYYTADHYESFELLEP